MQDRVVDHSTLSCKAIVISKSRSYVQSKLAVNFSIDTLVSSHTEETITGTKWRLISSSSRLRLTSSKTFNRFHLVPEYPKLKSKCNPSLPEFMIVLVLFRPKKRASVYVFVTNYLALEFTQMGVPLPVFCRSFEISIIVCRRISLFATILRRTSMQKSHNCSSAPL